MKITMSSGGVLIFFRGWDISASVKTWNRFMVEFARARRGPPVYILYYTQQWCANLTICLFRILLSKIMIRHLQVWTMRAKTSIEHRPRSEQKYSALDASGEQIWGIIWEQTAHASWGQGDGQIVESKRIGVVLRTNRSSISESSMTKSSKQNSKNWTTTRYTRMRTRVSDKRLIVG